MANLPSMWQDFDRPFGSMGQWRPLLRQLDDLMSDSFGGTRMMEESRSFVPSMDVEETEDHYVMSFDIPGIAKDDIDIEVRGNQLIVSGERKNEREGGEGRSRFMERRYGSFQRVMTLPDGVNSEGVEAHCENGVLTLAVPKSAESKPQKVKIGESKGGGFLNKLMGSTKKDKGRETVNIKAADRSEKDAAAS